MENKEKQVRKIAQRVMTKYKLHPPVDMMGLIQEKGITCVEENLGTNADGYSDLKDSDLKIVLNSAIQYEPRKRFTLAHELGHIFISWHSDVTLCVTDNEYSEHNKLDIQEHEANVFASEILMPTEWVKEMLTSSGTTLEEIVKQVLDELGFTILEAEKGRSDIIAKYGEVAIVAEIKGVTKSAAEKHAAQLEKWVAQYIEENEVSPKGMLIVNGFCDMPLNERLEDVFPQQMLKYCVSRGHVLLTSTQLLCLYIEVCKNPICKEERITELLSCVGKYERYREIKDYLK